MIKTLIDNDYPLDFIFATINSRIKSHKYNTEEENIQDNNSPDIISKKFKSLSHKFDFNIAYKSMNKLDKFIKRLVLKKEGNSNVTYKINCQDYDSSYVGQTKRKFKTRIKEHKADINKNFNLLSVVFCQLNKNHVLDCNNILILDLEPSYYKRTISEMIHIKKQKSGLNKAKQNDTDRLSELYLPLLNK